MTVPSTTYRNDYTGTAGTLVFPYTFRILDSADIVVTAQYTTGDPVTVTSGFTVSGVGSQSGGNITFSSAPFDDATLVSLTFTRNPADTQTFDIRNQTAIPRASLEDALDRRTMVSLKQQEEIDRSIKIPITDRGMIVTLPPAADRALKTLAFDASGNIIAGEAPTGGIVSVAMAPVVQAATIAAGRVAMGPWEDISAMGVANVKDPAFGAVGDGVADDTAAIQSALSSGRNVTIPKSSAFYRVTSELSISSDDISVEICGHIKLDTASVSESLLSSSGSRTKIFGGGILEGPGIYKDNTPGVFVAALITITGEGSDISDVELREPITAGIIINASDNCSVRNVRVVGGVPTYSGTQHYGILVYLSHYYTICGCRFEPSDLGNAVVHAINTVASNHGVISNNVAQTWEKLLYGYGNDCAISGNIFQGMVGNSGDCLRSIGSRCTITGNTVSGGGKGGISVFNGSDCVVSNNVITDCMNNGIQVGHYGGSTDELSRNTISSNIIKMRAYTGTETIYSGIEYATSSAVDCRDILIINNQIHDADRSGVNRAAIYVLPFSGSLFRGVQIEGNTIVNPGYEAVEMVRVRGGSVSRNKIYGAGRDFGNINSILFFATVSEVVVEGNICAALHDRRNSGFIWQPSGSGTNEFCLKSSIGGNPSIPQPRGVFAGNTRLTSGAAGALAAGSWAWGDNDALGYSTIYVRLADGADPDSKAVGHIMASHSDYAILLSAGQSNAYNKIIGNKCFGSMSGPAYYDAASDLNESRDNAIGWYPLVGSVTVNSGAGYIDVTNDNSINSDSCRIYLQPIDQNAATIDAGSHMAFIVSKTLGSGFRIQSQDGAAFGSSGKYSYRIDC